MKAGGIDSSRIESMLAQLKAAAQNPRVAQENPIASGLGIQPANSAQSSSKVSFSDALKSSLRSSEPSASERREAG